MEKLSRYKTIKPLGNGGYGNIYLGYDNEKKKRCNYKKSR